MINLQHLLRRSFTHVQCEQRKHGVVAFRDQRAASVGVAAVGPTPSRLSEASRHREKKQKQKKHNVAVARVRVAPQKLAALRHADRLSVGTFRQSSGAGA